MRIGIIGPSEDEINPFIECMYTTEIENYAMINFHKGEYKDIEVIALFCGVCKVNAAIATQILIDRFDVTHVIATGVAGAMNQKLNILDTIISSEVAYHDVEGHILTEYHPWMENVYFKSNEEMLNKMKKLNINDETVLIGKIVTGEALITEDGRDNIIKKYNPLCVDMETASIAHVCYANSIPFMAIRSVSDTPEKNGVQVFEEYCELASRKSINILKRYLDAI